jgi:hypothetical protein
MTDHALEVMGFAMGKEFEKWEEIDLPAHLAQKLSENETLRTGNFSPKQFKHLVENILRYELHKLEKEKE